jgi:uncharacterized membrane protein YkoI
MKTPLIAAGLLLFFAGGFAFAESEQAMMREAKVDRTHAEKIALAATHGGKIKSIELEREHGRLIWSCDIAMPSRSDVTEVAVDAKLAKVISVKKETAAQERAEAKAEKNEKH